MFVTQAITNGHPVLQVPTAYNFLTRYCKASGFSLAKKSNNVLEDKRALYTTYLVELSLVRP